MRCHKGIHTDQSDFEVGKTPNLDVRVTISNDGHVRSMVAVHLQGVTKATILTNQIWSLEKHLI